MPKMTAEEREALKAQRLKGLGEFSEETTSNPIGEELANQPAAPEPQSAVEPNWRLAAAGVLMQLAVPPAAAAEMDINISTPAIRKIEGSMKARHQQLEPYYASGALGVTADALVAVRDLAAIPLPQRNRAKQLVADENRDRGALYQEIARANGHPEWEPQIRETFAKRWADNARKRGWWVQGPGGGWQH